MYAGTHSTTTGPRRDGTRYGVTPSTTYRGMTRIAAFLSPSSPARLEPQQATEPSDVIPHVWATPAAMDVKRSPPATAVGLDLDTTCLLYTSPSPRDS